MSPWSIFNYRIEHPAATAEAQGMQGSGPATKTTSVSAFLTPQSLVTFPGACSVVFTLWKLAGEVRDGWGQNHLVALILSLVVGVLVYLISSADADLDPALKTPRAKTVSIVIALINSLFLFAAAIGAG